MPISQRSQYGHTRVLLGIGPVDTSTQLTLGRAPGENPGSLGVRSGVCSDIHSASGGLEEMFEKCRLASHVSENSPLYDTYNPKQHENYK